MSSKESIKKELKELKVSGEAPEWLNWMGYAMLKESYLLDQTPRERYRAIAQSAAKYIPKNLNPKEWEEKFFQLFWKGYLAASTPVMGNLGTNRGMAVSCSASYVNDTMWDISYTGYELEMLSKYGFGTAVFLDIRGGYENISTGGCTNPTGDWVEKYWFSQMKVSQGGLRRGSTAIYLDFWQKDLMDILPMMEKLEKLHLGVICDDSVRQALEKGDENAMRRYLTILQWRARKGKPYIIFIDNAKRQDPPFYKKLGLSTKQSNLCIAGDQRVPTQWGFLTAKELYEKDKGLIVFDGNSMKQASQMKLREESADIYEIELENGLTHKVTEYHGIPILDSRNNITKVRAIDLQIGDKVAIQTKKGIFGSRKMRDEGFLLGLYQSDGTQFKDKIMIDIWEKDFDLLEEIENKIEKIHYENGYGFCNIKHAVNGNVFQKKVSPAKFTDCVVKYSNVNKKRLSTKSLNHLDFDKKTVPQWIWESDEKTQWEYLRGLFYGDGTVFQSKAKGCPTQLSLASIHKDFLKQIQLIMNNLGMQSSIKLLRKEGLSLLPDGRGGYKKYLSKTCYRLVWSHKNNLIEFDKNTSFLKRKGIEFDKVKYRDNSKKSSRVKSVTYIGKEPVYCPTVYDDRHIFACNGFLTFNCTEIFQHTDSEHTLSCVLSSMVGSKFDEWKDTDAVFESTVFLDCVCQDLIDRGSNIKGLERVVASAKASRALGLGLLGFHTYLQQNMFTFDGFQARLANAQMFGHLKKEALRASKWLAKELGEPEWLKGIGMRNSHLLAIAPNTSSALIAGAVSQGIEPVIANVYQQKLAKVGSIERINPVLLKLLKERGFYNDDVIDEISFNKGSVQNLDSKILSDHEKEVFKTAYEINQKVVIDMAEQRQQFICQGQSLNLFFDANEDEEWIHEVHKHAFECKRLKSLYYVRTQPGITADKDDTCKSCEG